MPVAIENQLKQTHCIFSDGDKCHYMCKPFSSEQKRRCIASAKSLYICIYIHTPLAALFDRRYIFFFFFFFFTNLLQRTYN